MRHVEDMTSFLGPGKVEKFLSKRSVGVRVRFVLFLHVRKPNSLVILTVQ